MAIANVSLSNTFAQWIITTNQSVAELNTLKSGNYTKDTGTLFINGVGGIVGTTPVAFSNTTTLNGVNATLYVQNNSYFSNTININSGTNSINATGSIIAPTLNISNILTGNNIVANSTTSTLLNSTTINSTSITSNLLTSNNSVITTANSTTTNATTINNTTLNSTIINNSNTLTSNNITANSTTSILLSSTTINNSNTLTSNTIVVNYINANNKITSTFPGSNVTNNGQIFLNGTSSNRIDFNTNGSGAPTFNTRSVGTKVNLYPQLTASSTDAAVGVEASAMWFSIWTVASSFKWYGGTTLAATLTGTGSLSLSGNLTTPVIQTSQGTDIASVATIDLETATGNYVQVTGNTSITGITLSQGHWRTVKFADALTLTAGVSLVIPNTGNITTAAGDIAEFVGEAAGVVRCTSYTRADGQAIRNFTQMTAQTASGTAVTFPGIPAGVKRITIMMSGVSTVSTGVPCIRLGTSGGIEITGYSSWIQAVAASTTSGSLSVTSGFEVLVNGAANILLRGQVILNNVSGNIWTISGQFSTSVSVMSILAGDKTLAATLTQLTITTTGGTDTFDAGTINVIYE
jgi:hypothetical protein